MKFKLIQYKENIYASYWVIPLFIMLLAIAGSSVALHFEGQYNWRWLEEITLVFVIDPDGARTLLATIAAASVTITSVTFSITVLTLSLASQQLGPRLLPNFMRQNRTQVVLGVLIGTFIYCILILRAITDTNGAFTPSLAISIGILLGILSFFLLIYFIHYVCHVIQIDTVLDYLTDDLILSIQRQLQKEETADANVKKLAAQSAPDYAHYQSQLIHSERSGYVQTIDYNKLKALAIKHDVLLEVTIRPGYFIFKGLPVITAFSVQPLTEKALNATLDCLQIGIRRTTVQDIEFAFEQIAEIAVRALSPSVNNPFAAISCLDRVTQGIAVLNNYALPPTYLFDDDNKLRLRINQIDYQSIVDIALHRFRQYAKENLSVSIQLLINIFSLLQMPLKEELRQAVCRQAKMVFDDAKRHTQNENDLDDLQQRYEKIKSLIEKTND